MAWEPTWTNGQLATSPCGGSNCLCWSTARAVQRDSKGAISAITGDIRRWISGTTCGGTTLAQNVAAAQALYGVELTIRYSLPWADFLTLIESGRGAATYIGYAAMHGSGFDSFPTFNGGHGVYVGELSADRTRALVYDPGADGRYSGIPSGPQWWPLELLKKATGAMPAGSGTVGYGFVSAAFTRDTEEEASTVNPKYDMPVAVADVSAGTPVIDATTGATLLPSWNGGSDIGLYSRGGGNAAIRIDLGAGGSDLHVAYVRDTHISNVRLPGAQPPTGTAGQAELDAATKAGFQDAKAKALTAVGGIAP